MAYRVRYTNATRPSEPDQIRMDYALESVVGGVVTLVASGSTNFTIPNPPGSTRADRLALMKALMVQDTRIRIQAMVVADGDFAALQALVSAGQVVVTEAD